MILLSRVLKVLIFTARRPREDLEHHANRGTKLIRTSTKRCRRTVATLYGSIYLLVCGVFNSRRPSILRNNCLVNVVGANVSGYGHRTLPLRPSLIRFVAVARLCLTGNGSVSAIEVCAQLIGREVTSNERRQAIAFKDCPSFFHDTSGE